MAERRINPTARVALPGSSRSVIGRLLRSATLYDFVQLLAGERQFQAHLAAHLGAFSADSRLIDVGGGTGLARDRVASRRYVCLDLDLQKLHRFRGKRRGLAVAADATACPFNTACFDGVLCTKVAHHLSDAELETMLAETARILKPGGILILADPVRSSRWMSRVLWRLDRGSFPRSAAEIRRALPVEYGVTAWEEFRVRIFHDFVLCAARRATATPELG